MIFIDWDYDAGIATKYKRIGECNQCGDCCKMIINIKVANNDGDISARDGGGDTTTERGRWTEIGDEDEDRSRRFVRFTPQPHVKRRTCSELPDDNLCSLGNDRPWCCSVFPTSPSDIVGLENCSYEFVEISTWEFDNG